MPKIVGERKEVPETRLPPGKSLVAPHAWISENDRKTADELLGKNRTFGLYLSKVAEEKIRMHCLKGGDREVMGFLVGEVYIHDGTKYAIARDIATTDLESSEVSVRFDHERFGKLFEQLDTAGGVIVGWYHSHPGLGCFMSEKDLDTQRRMFAEDYHAALVVDPKRREICAYRLGRENKYTATAFMVCWDELQEPYSAGPGTRGFADSGEERIPAGNGGKTMSENAVATQGGHEFLGVMLYIIGAICFSFIPLAIELPLSLALSITGLVILIAGFALILKK